MRRVIETLGLLLFMAGIATQESHSDAVFYASIMSIAVGIFMLWLCNRKGAEHEKA